MNRITIKKPQVGTVTLDVTNEECSRARELERMQRDGAPGVETLYHSWCSHAPTTAARLRRQDVGVALGIVQLAPKRNAR